MRFIKKHWLLLVAAAAAIYFIFINKVTPAVTTTGIVGEPTMNMAGSVINNTAVKRYPPPGYAGAAGTGPFQWVAVGLPPGGWPDYTVIGWTAEEMAAHGLTVNT